MNRLHILVLVALLVAVATGCGGAHHYDGRLTAADSLMHDNPDSALTLVEAVNTDSLATEGDRAYHGLLLTQARYKAYQEITASDDSAITCAMGYYRSLSGEQEKLTRAYLYKGAVMEELGQVDSAMFYYKTAEAAASEKDYANLGQINTRIAALYRNYYADPQICYDKYNQALKYYKLAGNEPLQLSSLICMAGCSGITHKGDAERLLNQATQLAINLNDSLKYFLCQELLCRQLSFEGRSVARAKLIAMHCLNDYRDYVNHDLLLDLADIYVYSGMPDSAQYYLDLVTENAGMTNLNQVQTRKYLIMSDICRLEGNTALSSHYDVLSHQVSDSISNSKEKYQIQQIENTFNHRQHTSYLSQISHLQWMMMGISLIAVIVIALLTLAYLRRIRNTKAIIRELENTRLDRHEELVSQLDAKNGVIERLLNNLVMLMKSADIKETQKHSTTQLARQIKDTIVDVANDDFWAELRTSLDKKHYGLISNLEQTYGFAEKDLRFIELSCCGFSHLEIAIIMNYSPRYVFNKRKVLASKMGLDIPFQDYIDSLLANES